MTMDSSPSSQVLNDHPTNGPKTSLWRWNGGRYWIWVRKRLRKNLLNDLTSLILLGLLVWGLFYLVQWGIVEAVWRADSASACREIGNGACWAILRENARYLLFGQYPYAEQWRVLCAVLLLLFLILISCLPRFWSKKLLFFWIAGLVVIGILMWGGIFSLPYIDQSMWSGFPLTLFMSALAVVGAFPLGIFLALGRRTRLPLIRWLCTAYIEATRGIPFIAVLFISSVIFPLFMPEGLPLDKLFRAQMAFILFEGAYLAEVIRGGLQMVPRGQIEAAESLGFSYWQYVRLILLPQALRLVIPALINNFIGAFMTSSLVITIGLFDFLSTTKAVVANPSWRGAYLEVYLFTAFVYFFFCFFMSRYSQFMEKFLDYGDRRMRTH